VTKPGVSYVVEYKQALNDPDWLVLTNFAGNGAFVPVVDPENLVVSRFYRVRVP
jgi:hypothetical protein